MKKLLFFFVLTTLLCVAQGCMQGGASPRTLADVVKDKELADYLVGSWTYKTQGQGTDFYSETLTFRKESGYMTVAISYRKPETGSETRFLTYDYFLNFENDVMEAVADGVTKYYRIERASLDELSLYEKTTKPELRSEENSKTYIREK
jgi:hypothetical protein